MVLSTKKLKIEILKSTIKQNDFLIKIEQLLFNYISLQVFL